MFFLEILLSMHCLILASSWIIDGVWLGNQPSLKLKLARFLLVSCILSPLIVHCVNNHQQLSYRHFVSIDALQDYANQPILVSKASEAISEVSTTFSMGNVSYIQLFYVLLSVVIIFRAYKVLLSLGRLRKILAQAVIYRASGRLLIKISSDCHIPFSVSLFNKSYIVLPVSLFSSTKNVKIAIAHEGQHHRNGDCLWAYFIELLRVLFCANPGINRWNRILSELQELSCDEVLVRQPKISAHDYGNCLFQVVQTVSQYSESSQPNVACSVGMALGKTNDDCTFIIRRISMLSAYPPKTLKSLLFGVAFVGFSILVPIGIAYSAVGSLNSSKRNEIDSSHFDSKMQPIAEQEIKRAVQRYHAKSAAIAIINVQTGDLLAFAESGKNQNSWKSRMFSPGSTIKPFIAAAAIDSGTSSETKTYDCPSPYSIEGKTFSDYYMTKGPVSLTQAMAKSSNVCLIKVAQDTGLAPIRKKLTEFGFDMTSWWQANQSEASQLAMVALGGNIPVTIDSLAKSYALLANKGRPFKGGDTPILSFDTISSINHILENVVINGTAKRAAISGIRVAGKTGTVAEENNGKQGEQLALFAGFLPVDAPRYAMVVVIENGHLVQKGKILTSGGELAAPVFRQVVMNSFNHSK